jgi:hypothetical protein
MNENEFGGTKILKKPNPNAQMMQQQGPMQQQMMQQGPTPQQMMMQQQGPPPQQIMPQQMMQQGPPPQQMMPQQMMQQGPMPQFGRSKSNFNLDSKQFKLSVLVMLIFIILNSKIIWKQISRLPFMGSMDPSIIALVVNSIVAGVIFYLISSVLFKQ